MELVTKEDLQVLRAQLIDDMKRLLTQHQAKDVGQEWLKSKELRKLLNASAGTLQNLRIAGKLHPVKIAGTWYYSNTEVQSLFKK